MKTIETIDRPRGWHVALVAIWSALALAATPLIAAADDVSQTFQGPAVTSGTVIHSKEGQQHVLTLSKDFSIHAEPPDPHWRLVDSKGNVFLLDKLKVKDDKTNTRIVVPSYVTDITKVQMWCAFAEVVLGEAAFTKPVRMN